MSSMVDFVVVLKNYPSLMKDWFRLATTPVRDIMERLSEQENQVSTAEKIGKLTYKFPKKEVIPTLLPRKLSSFSDSEGKTRTIGILDYWSQNFLKPIHDDLMTILRGIKEDCTFDQTSFIQKLPKEGPYFSFDLTNATDRLPLSFQKEIIGRLYGKEVTEAWANILVSVPFSLKGHTSPVYYRCGQPMGGYSS
jgi:hypothetical protein